ncbi:MAG: TIGR01777 family oxidoreductase [Candidatus Dormibacteraeota bacterium]|uniref:TIGR01777 family oxidoreductase n=1 Tax=Candidatus Amunia macphersoniae TaxID=3127014 RepID=A0A934NHC3_9BACT|nr:TIGR01777 family oxidoreductase [Candidatus Dormibacteraeota bacterium]
MRVVVTGATGTIGSAVVRALASRGDEPVALTRDAAKARGILGTVETHAWQEPAKGAPPADALRSAAAVIHLLGEPIAQRWTAEAKRDIRLSRVLSTRRLVAGIAANDTLPTLVSQSATGYYGPHGDEWLTEDSPPGHDFLADLVVDWEREAIAAPTGVRTVLARTGVVLSPRGGALSKMLPPFRIGVGGPIAGGRQYLPWIHIDDVVGALLHLVDTPAATGAVNVAAPNPVTNAEMSAVLGHVLHRPAVMPVPAFAIRAMYGEMAATVLNGQRVSAAKLERLGYIFAHTTFESSVRVVLQAAA